MVGGLVILLVLGGVFLFGLLALVLGVVALVRIGRSNGAMHGRGLAVAAIVLGALMLLAPCLFAPLLWLMAGRSEPDYSIPAPPAPPISRPEPIPEPEPEPAPAQPEENP
jgi:hypothetical protein